MGCQRIKKNLTCIYMPYFQNYKKRFTRRVQSVSRPVKRGMKQRYVPKNKRGKRTANIGQIIRDISYIKRSLNTEHKTTSEITYGFNTAAQPLTPTSSSPIVQALAFPGTIGTSGKDDRIGKRCKITNLHLRWRLNYRTAVNPAISDPNKPVFFKIYVVWEKFPTGTSNIGQILDLWKPDPNNSKSYISQFNKLEYKNFLITYKNQGKMSIPAANNNLNHLQDVRYMEHNIKLNIHQEFDDDNILQRNRPFLVILTDNKDTSGEHIEFSLIHKMSYVDN